MSESNERRQECPLCIEEMDDSDLSFKPCPCGYQICIFCFNKLKDKDKNSVCPACRRIYREEDVRYTADTETKSKKKKVEKKEAPPKVVRNLENLRVIKKNLVYIAGVPPSHLSETAIRKIFEKYGKITRINVVVPQANAYIWYASDESARKAVIALDKSNIEDSFVRVMLGLAKYCTSFINGIKCRFTECLYLHELAGDDCTFTAEEVQQGKHYMKFGTAALAEKSPVPLILSTNTSNVPSPLTTPNNLSTSVPSTATTSIPATTSTSPPLSSTAMVATPSLPATSSTTKSKKSQEGKPPNQSPWASNPTVVNDQSRDYFFFPPLPNSSAKNTEGKTKAPRKEQSPERNSAPDSSYNEEIYAQQNDSSQSTSTQLTDEEDLDEPSQQVVYEVDNYDGYQQPFNEEDLDRVLFSRILDHLLPNPPPPSVQYEERYENVELLQLGESKKYVQLLLSGADRFENSLSNLNQSAGQTYREDQPIGAYSHFDANLSPSIVNYSFDPSMGEPVVWDRGYNGRGRGKVGSIGYGMGRTGRGRNEMNMQPKSLDYYHDHAVETEDDIEQFLSNSLNSQLFLQNDYSKSGTANVGNYPMNNMNVNMNMNNMNNMNMNMGGSTLTNLSSLNGTNPTSSSSSSSLNQFPNTLQPFSNSIGSPLGGIGGLGTSVVGSQGSTNPNSFFNSVSNPANTMRAGF